MRTGVVAALPRELAGLVRNASASSTTREGSLVVYEGETAVLACAGMGRNGVARAVAGILSRGDIQCLFSIGLAGGCDGSLRTGEVVRIGTVVDTATGERFVTGTEGAVLATTEMIAGAREKRRLYETYGAAVVDMEGAFVARLALAHGLPFQSLKAVSDDASSSLDQLNRFVTADGQFRELAFALHTALRPTTWKAAIGLGRASALALRALTSAVEGELRQTSGEPLPPRKSV